MEFEREPQHKLIVEAVRSFAQHSIIPIAEDLDVNDRWYPDLIQEAAKLDLLDMGGGLSDDATSDTVAALLSTIEIGAASPSVASTISAIRAHLFLLSSYGTDDQKAEWFSRLASGQEIAALGITEPEAGSDLSAIRTHAAYDGTHWTLNGSKAFISFFNVCSLYFVLAYTDRQAGLRSGLSVFLVDATSPGVTVGHGEQKLGLRGAPIGSVYFDDVRVPADALLGNVGRGTEIMMRCLDGARIEVAGQALGISRRCLELSVSQARQRKQFGRRIGDFQMIQQIIADMAVEADAGELLACRAASLRTAGRMCTVEASMAKLYCSENAMRHATQTIQMLGGRGYLRGSIAERLFRDAKVLEIYDGTNQIQRTTIAKRVLA